MVLGTASTAYFGIGPASVRVQLFAGLTSASLARVPIGTAGNQPYGLNTGSISDQPANPNLLVESRSRNINGSSVNLSAYFEGSKAP